ncbi:glycosyltransferase family 2 protein [Desarmillaria tabescens]|uniref:Glycosyltransferase family 2 protein n=1 Tax=Armillaria tabescens TaxID=1929756 RepID=A0AA39JLK5_ARMTA|nr:glycosyltransferase family 2 protein [Desarmillaria tabescens]KAK0443981.1 glycosyltransferase family 2 protein [Desarmillaria tabescens]
MASNSTQAIASGDLVDLVSSSGSATIYPSDDAILAVLQARFRADLPYTRVGASNLVVVNPYKTLANVNDISAKEYEERCYKDTSLPMVDSPKPLQPHLYDLAARVYLVMRRRNESQALLSRGITGAGKSSSIRLFINQILRLSSHSNKEAKVADQIKALGTILDSFGNAKTLMSPNASRHTRYLELHFNDRGRISSAKVLAFGLDKSRLNRLTQEERSYHIFYQLLAGATTTERDNLNIEDPSDYALLASSGTYRLPAGPFSDDSIAMGDLRQAMRILGFKPKAMSSIFSTLMAILLLGNLQFHDGDTHDFAAYVANAPVLDHIARLLGVTSEDLGQTLTNRTSYVRKELYTSLLNAEQAALQRDHFVRDLYAILFAFVVETVNHKLAPSQKDPPPHTQVAILDQPGFQTRGPAGTASMALSGVTPLISAYGQNGFDEFCINFSDELLHSYVQRHIFEDTVGYSGQISGDGISLPSISTMDNMACVELLRGPQTGERPQRKPGGVLGSLNKACSALKSGKGGDHRNDDLLQDLVTKFGVHASFVASPAGATSRTSFGINHYAGSCMYDVKDFIEKDTDLLDSAFVPLLRNSTDPFVVKLFSGPSLAAERHNRDESIVVQAQVSSLPLRSPTPIASSSSPTIEEFPELDRQKTYPVTTQINFTLSNLFATISHARLWTVSCIRPNDSGSSNSFNKQRVKSQVRALLLPDLASRRSAEYIADYEVSEFCERYGVDFALGHRMIWLSYSAWKMVEDPLRASEKETRKLLKEGGMLDDEDESVERDDTTEYTHQEGLAPEVGQESAEDLLLTRTGSHGTQYRDPNAGTYGQGGLLTPNLSATQRGFGPDRDNEDEYWDKSGGGGSSNGAPPYNNDPSKEADGLVVKEVANAVEEVPSWIGRMKRPDIRLAWREKVTICMLISFQRRRHLLQSFEFVSQHVDNDWWFSVQGKVYDMTNFVQGDHSDVPSGSQTSPMSPLLADHTSGALTSYTSSKLANADWYTSTFLPKMKNYYKEADASDDDTAKIWAVWDDNLYDLTDYFNTQDTYSTYTSYQFLDSGVEDVFKQQSGKDNNFYVGQTDFRKSARCQVQNYMLIVFTVIIMASLLAALQFGSKRNPELQDKFILCQLIFIICDGNIIGSGNDRTTPRILDPEPLLGSKALNYGKIYSGLYEFEGHVVPYMVVVKVGKPTERSKPVIVVNEDSQILLMHYLNRVHFDAAMSPLELEIYHQMRNVIGIDPAFYEPSTPESLNRLVASAADDSSIIGICGETKLENEEGSWWTMIQVYEYYLSHHLSKAFESLFGSVTCLPGCFSLYRIRTADKGRPIIISNRIIDEYAEPNNLFSLGEDRFLTTLLMKHFPTFKTKFCADAIARTVAPDSWACAVLLSVVDGLTPLSIICASCSTTGAYWFCCFSMRFFVFIDLLGTLLLYLIIVIAIIMLAVTYGLQALIFILKREFMLIGWMVVYILSYPVYSFFLPVYSFWCMDEFGWGNTRLVIGEGKDKKVIINEDEKFDESMIPLKKFSEYEAEAWETGSRHSDETGYSSKPRSRPNGSREESPHTYHQASQAGDYYRDTNLTLNNSSNPNLRLGSQPSISNMSHRAAQQAQYGGPFTGGPGSAHGSDYGRSMPQMAQMGYQNTAGSMPYQHTAGSMGMGMGMPQMGYQNTGSMYGMMPPMAPQNPMMPMNMLGGSLGGGSQSGHSGGFGPPTLPFGGGDQRPISTFSLATTVNPFAGPNNNPNPSDEELIAALRNYLSTQDLMTVSKKTAREAMAARFPMADLASRKDFLNKSIDEILSDS